jgi:hypothetical protein
MGPGPAPVRVLPSGPGRLRARLLGRMSLLLCDHWQAARRTLSIQVSTVTCRSAQVASCTVTSGNIMITVTRCLGSLTRMMSRILISDHHDWLAGSDLAAPGCRLRPGRRRRARPPHPIHSEFKLESESRYRRRRRPCGSGPRPVGPGG